MKRHGNLYPRIYAYDNLEQAYRKASRGRRYDPAVLRYHARLDENLIELQNELIWQTYAPAPYTSFTLHEPKERIIYVAPFRDRVLHHAVMNVVEPIWDRLFIADSFACRKGKGTYAGLLQTDRYLRSASRQWGQRVYCFKGDISKFFPSINHHVLSEIIARKIKCPSTLWLFDQIIFSAGDRDDLSSCNMPIGNLISQWSANLYLNELDHFVKETMRIRYYIRYMDDFIILHPDKAALHGVKREIEGYIGGRLRLRLNPKSDIYPAARGIDFLGYRIWPGHRLLRKANIIRASRRFARLGAQYAQGRVALEDLRASLMSWLGHAGHADTRRARRRVLASMTAAMGGQRSVCGEAVR